MKTTKANEKFEAKTMYFCGSIKVARSHLEEKALRRFGYRQVSESELARIRELGMPRTVATSRQSRPMEIGWLA